MAEQERDEHGRFAGGGGGASLAKGATGKDVEGLFSDPPARESGDKGKEKLAPGVSAKDLEGKWNAPHEIKIPAKRGDGFRVAHAAGEHGVSKAANVSEAKPHASNLLSWIKSKLGKRRG